MRLSPLPSPSSCTVHPLFIHCSATVCPLFIVLFIHYSPARKQCKSRTACRSYWPCSNQVAGACRSLRFAPLPSVAAGTGVGSVVGLRLGGTRNLGCMLVSASTLLLARAIRHTVRCNAASLPCGRRQSTRRPAVAPKLFTG